ncbi:uncharacterized protein EDB91DRAFT_1250520 [Suillus paluster]|uniref:uncharacterized protein n=1 Tax=Suillus paluster TaxID=48578 RepID=UPI001B8735A2|nr:uncharacterized protein EDB91DRAFT_1250520 [Suillus paluster]KAG1735304.1 hypothetical protein EDB91DRAFT_1250520 [Suillus paluster]
MHGPAHSDDYGFVISLTLLLLTVSPYIITIADTYMCLGLCIISLSNQRQYLASLHQQLEASCAAEAAHEDLHQPEVEGLQPDAHSDSSEDEPPQDGLGGGIDYNYHDGVDNVTGEPQPENANTDMPAQPFPELDNIFDGWDEHLPDLGPLDEFSTDSDEEIFEHLGRLNVEDSEDSSSDEEPLIPEGEDINLDDCRHSHKPLPCMDDHPAVRNAYIQAFISAAFYDATHAAVYHDLKGKEHLLHTAQQANPDIEYPGLDEFARTLPTLLKCLGLSTDQFIIYFFSNPEADIEIDIDDD